MPYIQLSAVKHCVNVGIPLPFNVRNADQTLLLARGQVVRHAEQMAALFERGTLVDLSELQSPKDEIKHAKAEQLPALWARSMERAAQALQAPSQENFHAVIDEVSEPLVALIEREPDLAIFQVLRQDGNLHTQYGVNHSLHCAIAVFLASTRLGWDAARVSKAFKAALTMNLSMLELQGQMATQSTPLTPEQRAAILSHPLRSVAMLELADIHDGEWLQAVAEHHEEVDGSGYPHGIRDISELASMLHRSDVYTAKLTPRRNREALAADMAARTFFAADPGNPLTTALVKEFGIYPPGCFVKLASGETAVVVRRGASVQTPLVAAITTPRGMPLTEPEPRQTSLPANAIVNVVGNTMQPLRVAPEKLARIACA